MILRIDGQAVPLGLVELQDINFGQPAPKLPALDYALELGRDELVVLAGEDYRCYAADDLEFRDPDVPASVRTLRNAGWPELAVAVRDHAGDVVGLTRAGFDTIILEAIFKFRTPEGPARFVLNSIEGVEFLDDFFRLTGRAYDVSYRFK